MIHLRSLFLLLILSTSLVAQEQPALEDETDKSSGSPVSVEEVLDDDDIEKRLEKILATRQRYSDVNVRVESGVVTFDGSASSDQDRVWPQELAERTEGVVVVDNQIEVSDDTSLVDIENDLDVVQKSLSTLWRDFLKRLPIFVVAGIVLAITGIVSRIVGNLLGRILSRRRRWRSSLKDLLRQLTTMAIWIAGLTVAAIVIFPGLTPAKALTVLGLGSVAIGFAFKDIFENFFAGVLILWRYPFDRGDFISCDDVTGRVEEITVRNTMIRRLDGELTVIPNAHLFKTKVDVLTSQKSRRVRINCGVAYGEDIARSRQVMHDAISKCTSVEQDRPIEVFANEFADSAVNFELAWWTDPSPTDIRVSRDEVVEAVKAALDSAGIEIPFPYRTLTFKEPLAVLKNEQPDCEAVLNESTQ
jgi:small-conductance mechanosensitive channel